MAQHLSELDSATELSQTELSHAAATELAATIITMVLAEAGDVAAAELRPQVQDHPVPQLAGQGLA